MAKPATVVEPASLPNARWVALKRDLKFLLCIVAVSWVVQIVDSLPFISGRLDFWMGIIPRELGHLHGVVTSVFAHANFAHLSANTLPWLVLGALTAAANDRPLWRISVVLMLLSGGLLWLLGWKVNAVTVGASGLIYAYFGYLLGKAWYGRQVRWIIVAGGALLLGGLIDGLVPSGGRISWEGHVFGVVAGMFLARLHHRSMGVGEAKIMKS